MPVPSHLTSLKSAFLLTQALLNRSHHCIYFVHARGVRRQILVCPAKSRLWNWTHRMCVCVLHIKRFFYSSTSSTPSVRADFSPQRGTSSVVTNYDTEIVNRNALNNAMPRHRTGYDKRNIHTPSLNTPVYYE